MSTLTSDAYDFGIESALSLFFKEAAVPFAGKGVRKALHDIAAGGARPSALTRKIPGTDRIMPPGGEAVAKAVAQRQAANPQTIPRYLPGHRGAPPVVAPPPGGRLSTASYRTKRAFVDVAIAGGLGASKAGRSKKHPGEQLEGALRGGLGWYGGGIIGAAGGGVLGAFAGAVLAAPGGPDAAIVGGIAGSLLGSLGGAGYGGYKGYQSLTERYNE